HTDPINIGNYSIDLGFFRTMGIQLIAGRSFDPNRPGDDSTLPLPADGPAGVAANDQLERQLAARGINVVINELAAHRLGFGNPADAVGKTVMVNYFDPDDPLV